MKVEIWSDVMCPFCYIGKRRFEAALEQFQDKDAIEVIWKSFQLNPDLVTDPGKNINEYLSETKGWTLDYAKQVNGHVTGMAKELGLNYNFDKAIVANSFDAHRLLQLARENGKGDEMEESLFRAYFTDGKNIADHSVLIELGSSIGLDQSTVQKMLRGNDYAGNVEQDIYEAQQIGIRGVPYFVFNDRYAVSGAQATETFLEALNKSWVEFEKENRLLKPITGDDGMSCTTDGECN